MDNLAAYSGGERLKKSISKTSLDDLSKGVDGGGIRGCMANMGGNLEFKLKLQDSWRIGCMGTFIA